MGNWWVTVNDELDAEDVTMQASGCRSSSRARTGDDPDFYAAFTDEDSGENGRLTYELVSAPDWLMINKATGVIQNQKGMLPPEEGGKFR